MLACADGDLFVDPPQDLPEELATLLDAWNRTVAASRIDIAQIQEMALPIVTFERDSKIIQSINRAGLRLLDYDNAGELVYENVGRIIDNPEGLIQAVRQSELVELQGRRKDGTQFDLEAETIGMESDGMVTVGFHDVTVRKALEAAMIESRDSAMKTAEMQANFLANVSHELRTPVNGVIGMAHLLPDTKISAEQRQHVEAIEESGTTLMALINDILDLAKIESGKMALSLLPSDIRGIMTSVIRLMSPQADANGDRIILDYPESVPRNFLVDAVRLQQVLINLVGNAVKFTCNGTITVSVRIAEASADSCLLDFQIADTGVGIPKDKLATIFDKFIQADASTTRKYGGTGLGLAICQEVTELMGGVLAVESVVGRGTTFSFCVPLCRAPNEIDQPLTGANQEIEGVRDLTGLRILVAEDNAINQVIARRMLEKLGCIVSVCDNGGDAAFLVEQEGFDLVLMDCMMPDVDGYEGTRQIRQREVVDGSHTPIIAVTAKAMKSDRDVCITAGMDDYLSKPFSPEALREVVERWCFMSDERRRRIA